MKIVSFNINSVRARPHQLEHLRDTLNPDVTGLQETKVNDPEFPMLLVPVKIFIIPLTPFLPAFLVLIAKEPLEDVKP